MKRTLLLFLLTAFIFSSCAKKDPEPVTGTEFLLDTVCTIKVYGDNGNEAIKLAFDEIKRLEALISTRISDSDISKVNAAAGAAGFKVSEEVYALIKKALEFSILTKGVFNVAVGPLVDLWGIGTENARIPSQQEIDKTLPLLDYMDVVLDDNERSVSLKKKGMSLDLGAIAKGYIADKVADVLKENGVTSAVVNLGGNVLVIGLKPDGSKWRIGIQDPFGGRNEYFTVYPAEVETLVSSGVYERYFIKDGQRYHHILDCKTGYPFRTDLFSVTVIGKNSETADALSTIIFSLGIEKGFLFIADYPGYELICVDINRNVTISAGLKEKLVISDESFKLHVHE